MHSYYSDTLTIGISVMKEKPLHGDDLGRHFIYESLIHHPRISGANLCVLGKETSKQEITICTFIL